MALQTTVTRTSPLLVTMPNDLLEAMRDIAKAHDHSLAAELRRAMREYIDRQAEASRERQADGSTRP
jgi:hypothetical protein